MAEKQIVKNTSKIHEITLIIFRIVVIITSILIIRRVLLENFNKSPKIPFVPHSVPMEQIAFNKTTFNQNI